jgi:hypothetical protein
VRARATRQNARAGASKIASMRPSIFVLAALAVVLLASGVATEFAPTAELPDLLMMSDGRPVETAEQWQTQRRPELKALLQQHILGTLPTTPPSFVSATALNFTNATAGGISSTYLRLAFQANGTAVEFDIELAWSSEAPGPLPLFLTQWNHRSWGLQAVQRGYMLVRHGPPCYRFASAQGACPVLTRRGRCNRCCTPERTLVMPLGVFVLLTQHVPCAKF